jgi:hypothetical protein
LDTATEELRAACETAAAALQALRAELAEARARAETL